MIMDLTPAVDARLITALKSSSVGHVSKRADTKAARRTRMFLRPSIFASKYRVSQVDSDVCAQQE